MFESLHRFDDGLFSESNPLHDFWDELGTRVTRRAYVRPDEYAASGGAQGRCGSVALSKLVAAGSCCSRQHAPCHSRDRSASDIHGRRSFAPFLPPQLCPHIARARIRCCMRTLDRRGSMPLLRRVPGIGNEFGVRATRWAYRLARRRWLRTAQSRGSLGAVPCNISPSESSTATSPSYRR